jgi:hypothetical protein
MTEGDGGGKSKRHHLFVGRMMDGNPELGYRWFRSQKPQGNKVYFGVDGWVEMKSLSTLRRQL